MVTSSDVPTKGKSVTERKPVKTQRAKSIDPAKQLVEAAKQMESATKELTGGKILVKMETDNYSYLTESGVKFTKAHPFQLVEESEADLLEENGGFRKASPQELIDFYTNVH